MANDVKSNPDRETEDGPAAARGGNRPVRLDAVKLHRSLTAACATAAESEASVAHEFATHFLRFFPRPPRLAEPKRAVVALDEARVHAAMAAGCAKSWEDHQNAAAPYALQHLPLHLETAEMLAELCAVGRDRRFLIWQDVILQKPNPALSLDTIQRGRDAAIALGDVPQIAEFALLEAEFRHQLFQVDLWRMFGEGNVKGALSVTRQMVPVRRILWLLCLLSHPRTPILNMEDRLLEELRTAPLESLGASPVLQILAAHWLPAVGSRDQALLLKLQKRMLTTWEARLLLCQLLIQKRSYQAALLVTRTVDARDQGDFIDDLVARMTDSRTSEVAVRLREALAREQETGAGWDGIRASALEAGVREPVTAEKWREDLVGALQSGNVVDRSFILVFRMIGLASSGNPSTTELFREVMIDEFTRAYYVDPADLSPLVEGFYHSGSPKRAAALKDALARVHKQASDLPSALVALAEELEKCGLLGDRSGTVRGTARERLLGPAELARVWRERLNPTMLGALEPALASPWASAWIAVAGLMQAHPRQAQNVAEAIRRWIPRSPGCSPHELMPGKLMLPGIDGAIDGSRMDLLYRSEAADVYVRWTQTE